MNDKIRKQIAISNPFHFKHISYLKVSRDSLIIGVHGEIPYRELISLMILDLPLSWLVRE